MKKIVVIVIILVFGAAGFLYYDWHVKTQKIAVEPSITLYSWTDRNGAKHFTDTAPPQGAEDIVQSKGYKYIQPPWVVKIKNKTVKIYKQIKDKMLKKNKKTI